MIGLIIIRNQKGPNFSDCVILISKLFVFTMTLLHKSSYLKLGIVAFRNCIQIQFCCASHKFQLLANPLHEYKTASENALEFLSPLKY